MAQPDTTRGTLVCGNPLNQRIPVEIISKIFSHIKGDERLHNAAKYNPSLRRVCRLWNLTLVNEPRLWVTDVMVTPRHHLGEKFARWMQISRHQVLRMKISYAEDDEVSGPSLAFLWERTRPYLTAIVNLSIQIDHSRTWTLEILYELATAAPNLEWLHIEGMADPQRTCTALPLAVFPAVKELRLGRCLAFPNIQCPEMKAFQCIRGQEIAAERVLSFIASAPKLEHIWLEHLDFKRGPTHPIPNHLRMLKHFTVNSVWEGYHEVGFESCSSILRDIINAGPTLTMLTIDISTLDLLAPVFPVLCSLPNLKDLNVFIPILEEDDFDEYCASLIVFWCPCQSLESLSITASQDFNADSFVEDALYPNGHYFYPNLKSLKVIGAYLSREKICHIFMKSRGLVPWTETVENRDLKDNLSLRITTYRNGGFENFDNITWEDCLRLWDWARPGGLNIEPTIPTDD